MTAALEGGEWSAERPGRTLPPGKTRYQFYRRLGGPQGRSGRAENLVPTGIRSRMVQPGPHTHTHTHIYIYIYIYNLYRVAAVLSTWNVLSNFGLGSIHSSLHGTRGSETERRHGCVPVLRFSRLNRSTYAPYSYFIHLPPTPYNPSKWQSC